MEVAGRTSQLMGKGRQRMWCPAALQLQVHQLTHMDCTYVQLLYSLIHEGTHAVSNMKVEVLFLHLCKPWHHARESSIRYVPGHMSYKARMPGSACIGIEHWKIECSFQRVQVIWQNGSHAITWHLGCNLYSMHAACNWEPIYNSASVCILLSCAYSGECEHWHCTSGAKWIMYTQ